MKPYEIEIENLKQSNEIHSEKDFIKLELLKEFLKAIQNKTTDEVLKITGLDKSDLSRIKALSYKRFSIGRLIDLLESLGYETKLKIKKKKGA